VTTGNSRAEVLKQLKDLFELKSIGAITEEGYEQKKPILMKDL
jgi:predicted RNase H-like HicB family nuclease